MEGAHLKLERVLNLTWRGELNWRVSVLEVEGVLYLNWKGALLELEGELYLNWRVSVLEVEGVVTLNWRAMCFLERVLS